MYMVYTCFATLSVAFAVFWRPQRFDRRGILYLLCCIGAATSHQHFVLFVPGLMLLGARDWLLRGPCTIRQLLRLPTVVAPTVALALVLTLHLGENYLPRAFKNLSSTPTNMAAASNFAYPLRVAAVALPLSLLTLLGVMIGLALLQRRRPGHNDLTTALTAILVTAYLALSLTLPNPIEFYVAPVLPVLVLAIVSVAVVRFRRRTSPAAVAAVLVLLVGAGVVRQNYTSSTVVDARARLAELTEVPSQQAELRWLLLREWANERNAVVLTSEPEIALLRLDRADYHVRNYGVPAEAPCDLLVDDGFAIPYAHSKCQIDAATGEGLRAGRPVVFVGTRLKRGGTIWKPLSRYIRKRFGYIGTIDSVDVYCYGGLPCDLLGLQFSEIVG
jgi:hypothetical protein